MITQKFKENTDLLVSVIDDFSDSEFHAEPGVDEWSAAEVIEHLFRAEMGIPRLFSTRSDIETRPVSKVLLEQIKHDMLDDQRKVKAPKNLYPNGKHISKNDLLMKFKNNRDRILELASTLDLSVICNKYEHPVYGYLTRAEWIHFLILHAQRHLKQLRSIAETVKR